MMHSIFVRLLAFESKQFTKEWDSYVHYGAC